MSRGPLLSTALDSWHPCASSTQAATGTTATWRLDHLEVTPPAPGVADGSTDSSAAVPKACVFPSKDWLIPDNGFYTFNKQLPLVDFKVR